VTQTAISVSGGKIRGSVKGFRLRLKGIQM
jgi:hypothetical protein